jgi:hypothetical protein
MMARVTNRNGSFITIETTIDISGSMLKAEESILAAVNEVGATATGEAMRRFDADGGPISVGGVKWYSSQPKDKFYQTPFGEIGVQRRVYQRAEGGKTYCPMEVGARIMRNATPRFAKMVSHKLAQSTASEVKLDFENNHGRPISKLLAQELSAFVSAIAQAKEELWSYAIPNMDSAIATIGIGLDGTCKLPFEKQPREAMTGNISLFDALGNLQHTIFVGDSREGGKENFYVRMEKEITDVKERYPTAHYIGIVDGEKTNIDFLHSHVEKQIIDFHCAATYLTRAADAMFERDQVARETWLENHLAKLKNDRQGAQSILGELSALDTQTWKIERKRKLIECVDFFHAHHDEMQYFRFQTVGMPISSGDNEAASKTLVERRFARSGMRWKGDGAQVILNLRTLLLTETRWTQFWQKVEQFGVPEVEND